MKKQTEHEQSRPTREDAERALSAAERAVDARLAELARKIPRTDQEIAYVRITF